MMSRGRLSAVVMIAVFATPCAASVIMVPCDLPHAEPSAAERIAPVVHYAHPVKRVHRTPAGKRGRAGFHLLLARGMCPVWIGEGNELGDLSDFYAPSGGGGYFEDAAATDFGGFEAGLTAFGEVGGGGGALLAASPSIFDRNNHGAAFSTVTNLSTIDYVTNDYVTNVTTITNITNIYGCENCAGYPPAVPEASTWAMIAMGLGALSWMRWRRT